MAHKAIQCRRSERDRRILPAAQIEVDLPQSEEIEMIYEESTRQHSEPTDCEHTVERRTANGILYIPYLAADRAPLPEQEQEQETRKQDIRAALDRLRDKTGPCAFEPLASHHAVLDRKHQEQSGIYEQCQGERALAPRID